MPGWFSVALLRQPAPSPVQEFPEACSGSPSAARQAWETAGPRHPWAAAKWPFGGVCTLRDRRGGCRQWRGYRHRWPALPSAAGRTRTRSCTEPRRSVAESLLGADETAARTIGKSLKTRSSREHLRSDPRSADELADERNSTRPPAARPSPQRQSLLLPPAQRGDMERSSARWTAEPLRSPATMAHLEWPLAAVAHWRRTHRGSALATSISSRTALGTQWHACLSIARDAREELAESKRSTGRQLELEPQCSGTRATACQRLISARSPDRSARVLRLPVPLRRRPCWRRRWVYWDDVGFFLARRVRMAFRRLAIRARA